MMFDFTRFAMDAAGPRFSAGQAVMERATGKVHHVVSVEPHSVNADYHKYTMGGGHKFYEHELRAA